MNYKIGLGGAFVVALVLVGTLVWPGIDSGDNSSNSSNDGPTFVVAPVELRTLTDEITVRGEIRRDQLQRITSGVDGRVSTVLVENGDTVNAGDVLYAIDGRAAVAVDGEFSFFRRLDVGSDGPDVLQLETILSNDGFEVGIVDQLFTEETRAGLREWQINREYGGETPEPNENIVVSLRSNSAGYTIGAQNTISFELEPSVPNQPVSFESHQSGTSRSLLFNGSDTEGPYVNVLYQEDNRPRINVTANPITVIEGTSATFTFTSDIEMPTDTVIDYVVTGSATAEDDYDDGPLDGSFIFPQGAQSFDLEIQTLTDDEIEAKKKLSSKLEMDLG
ncbi:MAG: biotin/lipoyl-binding protein [Acidimicrobiales bacterium]|nr:biotin/lipoyl-binding protein [Acidimicrobiales bacterium]